LKYEKPNHLSPKIVFGQKRVTDNDDEDRIIVSSYKLVRTTNYLALLQDE